MAVPLSKHVSALNMVWLDLTGMAACTLLLSFSLNNSGRSGCSMSPMFEECSTDDSDRRSMDGQWIHLLQLVHVGLGLQRVARIQP